MNMPKGDRHDDRIRGKQLRTFRSLFVAREDAHAVWMNETPQAIRTPLNDDVLVAHFNGDYRVGTYLIRLDGRTPFLVFDVDIRNRKIAKKIVKRLRTKGVSAYVERSKSKGFHVWIFFPSKTKLKETALATAYGCRCLDLTRLAIAQCSWTMILRQSRISGHSSDPFAEHPRK
jgi:hypothetical protein